MSEEKTLEQLEQELELAKKKAEYKLEKAAEELAKQPIPKYKVVSIQDVPLEKVVTIKLADKDTTLEDTIAAGEIVIIGNICEHLRVYKDGSSASCFKFRAHPNKAIEFDPRSAPTKCTSIITGCKDYD